MKTNTTVVKTKLEKLEVSKFSKKHLGNVIGGKEWIPSYASAADTDPRNNY